MPLGRKHIAEGSCEEWQEKEGNEYASIRVKERELHIKKRRHKTKRQTKAIIFL